MAERTKRGDDEQRKDDQALQGEPVKTPAKDAAATGDDAAAEPTTPKDDAGSQVG